MADESHRRRSDVLAMGLFGVAVGALTLGLAQLGAIPDRDHIGTMIIALAFGGLMQFLAGIAIIRFHEPLCGVALATYGFFWITVCTAKLVSAGTTFQLSPVLYAQLNFVYFVFSAVMVYFTAYRSATLSPVLDGSGDLLPHFLCALGSAGRYPPRNRTYSRRTHGTLSRGRERHVCLYRPRTGSAGTAAFAS